MCIFISYEYYNPLFSLYTNISFSLNRGEIQPGPSLTLSTLFTVRADSRISVTALL